MRNAWALLLVSLLAQDATAQSLRGYVGTFTPGPGEAASANPAQSRLGEGIYLVDIDAATGALGAHRLAARSYSPTWIAIDPARNLLFASNEYRGPDNSGTVSAFAMDRTSGALTLINTKPTRGQPAHMAIHSSGKFVLAANHGGGSIAVLPVGQDGTLGDATDVFQAPAGAGRSVSQVHFVTSDPSGRFVVANDAGTGKILTLRLDPETGKLALAAVFDAAQGSTPRHGGFSPDGRTFYNLFERTSAVGVYDFDPRTGAMTERQMVSALPPDFAGRNTGGELLVSRDGARIYVTNRGHDTVATLGVDASGKVSLLGESPSQNDAPRSLAFDPTGRLLFAMNQAGGSVTSFRIDPATGVAHYAGHALAVNAPATMVVLAP